MTGGPLCFGEQGVERFREFGLEPDSGVGVLVGQHEDLLEEGLVEQSPDVLGGAEVGIVGVGGEVQREAEVALDDFPLLVGGVEFGLDAGKCLADAVLLLAEQVDGDRAGVVGLHEFPALSHEAFARLLQLDASSLDDVASIAEFVSELGLDLVAEGVVELDPQVEVFDLALDLVDQHRTLGAAGPLGVPPCAVEVGVDLAA